MPPNKHKNGPQEKSRDEYSSDIEQTVSIHGQVWGNVIQIGKLFVERTESFKHLTYGQVVLGILIVFAFSVLYLSVRPSSPNIMTGDFRIAIAGFSQIGGLDSDIGISLAEGIQLRLQRTIENLDHDFTITVWGPEQIGTIAGLNASERAISAQRMSEEIGADLILYGTVSTDNSVWRLTPEFYVSANNFYEAAEIKGQHELGTALSVAGQGNVADRIEVSSKLSSRIQALAQISIGLSYYANGNFSKALIHFQAAEDIENWGPNEGKEVLYLLAGNAAIKNNEIELANNYYLESLVINSQYARGYLGIANVYYRMALLPFEETLNPNDIDHELLDLALAKLDQASESTYRPLNSDISTKIHFEFGQIYLMQVYSGQDASFHAAITEFEAVIADYGNGANPRVREQAAEAYARLGLIYDLSGYIDMAIEEYTSAVTLLDNNSERRKHYEQRINELKEKLNSGAEETDL